MEWRCLSVLDLCGCYISNNMTKLMAVVANKTKRQKNERKIVQLCFITCPLLSHNLMIDYYLIWFPIGFSLGSQSLIDCRFDYMRVCVCGAYNIQPWQQFIGIVNSSGWFTWCENLICVYGEAEQAATWKYFMNRRFIMGISFFRLFSTISSKNLYSMDRIQKCSKRKKKYKKQNEDSPML